MKCQGKGEAAGKVTTRVSWIKFRDCGELLQEKVFVGGKGKIY